MDSLMAIGVLATVDGCFQYRDGLGDVCEVGWAPSGCYLKNQPREVPVLMRHDRGWPLGSVVYLERSKDGMLAALTLRPDIEDLLCGKRWYLSPAIGSSESLPGHLEGIELSEVSLTPTPAITGIFNRTLVYAPSDTALPPARWSDVWKRAKDHVTATKYRPAPKLTIVDRDPLSAHDEFISDRASWNAERDATLARARAAADRQALGRVYRHHVGGRVVSFG